MQYIDPYKNKTPINMIYNFSGVILKSWWKILINN